MLAALMSSVVPRVAFPPPPTEDWAGLRAIVRAVIARTLNMPAAHPDVDDCTSETIRRAIEGRERLRSGEPMRPWVIGIARHVALDAIRARKRARDRRADGPESQSDLTDRVPDSKPGPFDRVARAQDAQKVRAALAKLPENTRRALELFHIEGKTYPEIATELAVPLGTVATWILRGRKAIAAELQGEIS